MRLSIIAAVAENGVIGRGNALPWHLPNDLKRFKQLTTGHAVIMGRRTWESIRKPLPHRRNIVISSSLGHHPAGVTVVADLAAALQAAADLAEVFVIGGTRVFEAALPLADRLEITRDHAAVPGDAFFPAYDPAEWSLTAEEKHPADPDHAFPYSFLTFERHAQR